jgi:AcrR family transcriptional regulator
MELKDRIIEQAYTLFFQYGIRAITMDEISSHMGISKRTIYEVFKDKDELLACCIKQMQQLHKQKHAAILANSSNTIEAFFKFLLEGIQAIKTINPLFFKDIQKYHSTLWKKTMCEQEAHKYESMQQMIEKGVSESLIRSDINPAIVTRIMFEQMNILSNEEVFPPDRFSKTEVFENIMVNFVRGIATTKGIEVIDELLRNHRNTENRL